MKKYFVKNEISREVFEGEYHECVKYVHSFYIISGKILKVEEFEEKNIMGTTKFKSKKTWKVGNQEWSDVIIDGKKELFTFDKALAINKKLKDGWRVPTKDDFITLDALLGGIGSYQNSTAHRDKYLNDWSGAYGGICFPDGELLGQGSSSRYWSQSELDADRAYGLYFDELGRIDHQYYNYKEYGFSLRCVR